MADALPGLPDPTKIMSASAEAVSDIANVGIRSVNDIITGLQTGASKAASTLNLPAAPAGLPSIPEVPSLSAGLPALPAGLPALPGFPAMGGGGSGGGGQPPAPAPSEKKAAGPLGYGEHVGSTCARIAGAGALGYGEK